MTSIPKNHGLINLKLRANIINQRDPPLTINPRAQVGGIKQLTGLHHNKGIIQKVSIPTPRLPLNNNQP